jgi:hypothetical protein
MPRNGKTMNCPETCDRFSRYRIALLVGIVCIIPLGYGVRFSTRLDSPLLQDIAGGVAYQILLMMCAAFVWPRVSPGKCAVGVFVFSSAIEFLQLCKAPALLAARATWLGRVILGNTFLWSDFPPYAIGCAVGWVVLRALRRKFAGALGE